MENFLYIGGLNKKQMQNSLFSEKSTEKNEKSLFVEKNLLQFLRTYDILSERKAY